MSSTLATHFWRLRASRVWNLLRWYPQKGNAAHVKSVHTLEVTGIYVWASPIWQNREERFHVISANRLQRSNFSWGILKLLRHDSRHSRNNGREPAISHRGNKLTTKLSNLPVNLYPSQAKKGLRHLLHECWPCPDDENADLIKTFMNKKAAKFHQSAKRVGKV